MNVNPVTSAVPLSSIVTGYQAQPYYASVVPQQQPHI